MSTPEADSVRLIKKYPNRRYYDTQTSTHVTLQQMHALVLAGQDLHVVDSKTDEDITNLVLLQIVLEKDHPKLDLFPSSIIHTMIRSNRQVLRASLESLFGPFWGMVSQSQRQFDAFWRQMVRSSTTSPMEWAGRVMQEMNARPAAEATEAPAPREHASEPPLPSESGRPPASEAPSSQPRYESAVTEEDGSSGTIEESSDKSDAVVRESTIEELKRQVADLTTRIDGLNPR